MHCRPLHLKFTLANALAPETTLRSEQTAHEATTQDTVPSSWKPVRKDSSPKVPVQGKGPAWRRRLCVGQCIAACLEAGPLLHKSLDGYSTHNAVSFEERQSGRCRVSGITRQQGPMSVRPGSCRVKAKALVNTHRGRWDFGFQVTVLWFTAWGCDLMGSRNVGITAYGLLRFWLLEFGASDS